MFTGIVELTGRISTIDPTPDGRRLTVAAPELTPEMTPGQSVSVDGACLTVESVTDDRFEVFLAQETIDRTTLGDRTPGDHVNLERAMPADGRFDGHIVQGHVDTTATVTGIDRIGEDWEFTVAVPPAINQYVVEKGSIAIDGISLTVAGRTPDSLTVAIIPHTYDSTTLSAKEPGDRVNVEVDIIAKYVESLVETRLEKPESP